MYVIPNGQLLILVNYPLETIIKILAKQGFVRSHQAYEKPDEALYSIEKLIEPEHGVVAAISFLSSEFSPIQVNLKIKIYDVGALLPPKKVLEYQSQIVDLILELFSEPKLEYYLEV